MTIDPYINENKLTHDLVSKLTNLYPIKSQSISYNGFRYVRGVVNKILIGGSYDFSSVAILTEYGEENISLSRLFIKI